MLSFNSSLLQLFYLHYKISFKRKLFTFVFHLLFMNFSYTIGGIYLRSTAM